MSKKENKPTKARTFWTPKEDSVLIYLYPNNRTEDILAFLPGKTKSGLYYRAEKLGLKKAPGLVARLAAEAMANPNHGGRRSQFQKGVATWNKGKSYMPGGRCSEGWFKPGQKPHTTMAVGSYRVTTDKSGKQYLEQKYSDASGNNSQRWKGVHRLVWEAAHGPVAPGYVVTFKPGMHSIVLEEITLDRLECISRQDNMRRNSYHQYGPEVAKVVQLRGAIQRQINKREQPAA